MWLKILPLAVMPMPRLLLDVGGLNDGQSRALAIFFGHANETAMVMRNGNTGQFEVYDIANNAITFAGPVGQVGLEWTIAGFGDFSGNANETDMLMRNSNRCNSLNSAQSDAWRDRI